MILTKKIAEELVQNKPADRKSPDFSEISKLSKEGFEFLLTNKIHINFPSVTEIEVDILRLLLNYNNFYTVSFDGLVELGEDHVDVFSKLKASISLNGIKSISRNILEKFTKREKSTSDSISFNGLIELDDETFEELTKIKSPIYLDGLKDINVKNAKSLVKNHSELFSLNGLKHIEQNVAEILLKFKGYLSLKGLENISEITSNTLIKFIGKSLTINKTLNPFYNKSLFIETYPNNSLSICIIKLKLNDGFTYLYAIGNSGGGVYSEYICKYQKNGSVFNIYKSNSLKYDFWDEYSEDGVIINSKNLEMSESDNQSFSSIFNYAKSEWLNYEDGISVMPNSLKIVKKNIFSSKLWEEEGVRIMQIISKNWNLSYRWK
jgi:hypothetical protein